MNKNLFASATAAPPDAVNHAGGDAYSMSPDAALAQLACTGVFADTYYVKAEEQLDTMIAMAKQCSDEFVAQVAVYARQAGNMKDAPAILLAYLFGKQSPSFTPALFDAVIDNVKMLSNFVQAVRSAKFGRRSLGTKGKRIIANWLNQRDLDYLYKQSIAKDPSLADIIKLSRPRPNSINGSPQRNALYRHLIGKEAVNADLPQITRDVEAFKLAKLTGEMRVPLPDVPFNMIDNLPLTPEEWRLLFRRGGLQFTRMNLNTAQRHGVFNDESIVNEIAARLSDSEAVRKSKQFPYQWLMAYLAVKDDIDMPNAIKKALHAAMEHATMNVPSFDGEVYVAVDSSGSMSLAVTGDRGRSTTKARYCDVAALFAACVVRTSPNARVIAFDEKAVFVPMESMDTVMTMATKLARCGGGTDCSAPLCLLVNAKRKVDLFILISDNESWYDASYYGKAKSSDFWTEIVRRNPGAKQVRINISPNATDQLPQRKDTLRVGGFNDSVFSAVNQWYAGKDWVDTIRSMTT